VLLFHRYLLIQSSLYYEVLRDSGEGQRPIPQLHVTQSIRLTTIIYIDINLVNTWRFSTVLANLVQLLKESLERTALTTFWLLYSDILLVVLLIGGIGGAGRLERAWFVERLGDMALALDLDRFDAVEAMLGGSLVKNMVGQTVKLMRRLWEDVQVGKMARMMQPGLRHASQV
jgi:hypothetical protein